MLSSDWLMNQMVKTGARLILKERFPQTNPSWGHPNSRFKIQDPRSQDSRSKIPRFKIQDPEIKIQKSRSRNQDPEIKIPKSRSRNQDPEIKIQKSRIPPAFGQKLSI